MSVGDDKQLRKIEMQKEERTVSPCLTGCTEKPLVYKSSFVLSTPPAVAQYTSNCAAAVNPLIDILRDVLAVPAVVDDEESVVCCHMQCEN